MKRTGYFALKTIAQNADGMFSCLNFDGAKVFIYWDEESFGWLVERY